MRMAYNASDYYGSGDKGEYKEYDLSDPYADRSSKKKKEDEISAADRKYYKSLRTRYRGDEHINFDELQHRGGLTWYILECIWDWIFRR